MVNGQFTKEENSFARLSANEESLCTSETSETVSQKLSWLTHSDPQRGERGKQRKEWGRSHTDPSIMIKDKDYKVIVMQNLQILQ